MFELLERIAAQPDDVNDIDCLIKLVQLLRPARPNDVDSSVVAVRTLLQLLKGNPRHAVALRRYLMRVQSTRRQTSLYTDLGILSSDGFFSELFRRISYRMLPPALDDVHLNDSLDRILYAESDYLWIQAVPEDEWLELYDVLRTAQIPAIAPKLDDSSVDLIVTLPVSTAAKGKLGQHETLLEILEAIQTVSYRISAMGLEPALIRIHPEIEAFESPFLMQNVEVHRYLESYVRRLSSENPQASSVTLEEDNDARHLLVMLDQCKTVIAKIRKNALSKGTSVALTYLLVRMTQNIDRLHKLLSIVDVSDPVEDEKMAIAKADASKPAADSIGDPRSPQRQAAVSLALELVKAHNQKYAVRELLASNVTLLARNVTENASRTGEHYIAENRSEYRAMFRSCAGAGFIVGFMALLKILTSYLRAAPLVEAFLFSLNYSVGFMLCHVLHFTFATKQPAMTASRIAAGLKSDDGRHIDLDSMSELCVKVLRTQFIAVLGNLATAIPTAYLLALGYFHLIGQHLVSPAKAEHLLHDIDPFTSLALMHGAMAGVCLFLAGLISGYYDNKAMYTRIAQRVARLRGLHRLLGPERLGRFAQYMENNLGGLMGNFYLGIMLASIGTIGFMLGLPIDVRHVTLSSTNLAVALVGLDNDIEWQVIAVSAIGILGIGAMNLLVSFGLALFVALRSRQVTFTHGLRLLKALFNRFLTRPKDFFYAPKDVPELATVDSSAVTLTVRE
ncbi:site-specific recombinase [soil metagenome]